MIDLSEFPDQVSDQLFAQQEEVAHQLRLAYAEPEKYAHEIPGLEERFQELQKQRAALIPAPVDQAELELKRQIESERAMKQAASNLIARGEIDPGELPGVLIHAEAIPAEEALAQDTAFAAPTKE